jgi:hypothetical protein
MVRFLQRAARKIGARFLASMRLIVQTSFLLDYYWGSLHPVVQLYKRGTP